MYRWFKEAQKEDWAGKKILVAGGTGFLGRHFIKTLCELGCHPAIISRSKCMDTEKVSFIQADLEDKDRLKKAVDSEYDTVVYLAARMPFTMGRDKKESFLDAKEATLDPFINFAEVFIPHTKKLIYASSIDAVGPMEDFDERTCPNPTSPYGLAKLCGEYYADRTCRENHAECVSLRFSQIYGADEPAIKIIPTLREKLISGNPFHLVTTGNEKRKYLYIDDAVQAVIRSISGGTGVFNIAGNDEISMNDLIKVMETVWETKLNIIQAKEAKQGVNIIPVIDKAKKVLYFEPEVSLIEGLQAIRNCEI